MFVYQKLKKMFEKGSTTNWSKEVFKITSIDDNDSPVMFQLEDLDGEEITGKFYQQELQKVNYHISNNQQNKAYKFCLCKNGVK